MTPAARLSAAIDLLDTILDGAPAEKTLTTWARKNRYAGSKDRAQIRDHVFDALRCRRSYAALGGAQDGRGLILGLLRAAGTDPATIFTGDGYGPSALTEAERAVTGSLQDLPELVAHDCPDWLAPALRDALGADFLPVMQALRHRAPLFLRVNSRLSTRDDALKALAAEGIGARPHDLSPTAIEVLTNPRKVQLSQPFRDGWVEVQDAASQAVSDLLPLSEGQKVLDFCAGGGGKTLALAGRVAAQYHAHDALPQRMRDLPERASRAGVSVTVLATDDLAQAAPFDLVFCDVPCSGSGAWRRSPEAKWQFSQADLDALCDTQAQILAQAAPLVSENGVLAYLTCSLLEAENRAQIDGFLSGHEGWSCIGEKRLTPLDGGDGFYVAQLQRV